MSRLIAALKRSLLVPRSLDAGAAGVSVQRWLSAPALNVAWMQRQVRMHLGWPGLLGLGLLAAYMVFYLAVIEPTKTSLLTTQQNVQMLQQKIKSGGLLAEQQQTPEAKLAKFNQSLPADKASPEWIEKIFAIAEQEKVGLDEGEYEAVRSKKGRLIRYQITLPITAEYPQIRAYLAALMIEIPFLALEQVEFRRQKVGESEVEAKIKLVIFFVGESA